MPDFTAHEGQDTVIVRGGMHHVALTESEFQEWLNREACVASSWIGGENGMMTCLVRRSDRSVRCIAVRLIAENFEPVY